MLLRLFCISLLILSYSQHIVAADISTYTVGNMKIIRLVDSENGLPTQLLYGDNKVIERIVPNGLCPNSISAYVLESPDGLMLIDTGFGELNPSAMLKHFVAANYQPQDVKAVILTHLHSDHMGGLLKDKQKVFPNATLYINDVELRFWQDKANLPLVPEKLRFCFDVVQTLCSAYQGQIKTFTDKQYLFPWIKAILVPGHTAGHTMFEIAHNGQKLFLWGDIVHCLAVQAQYPDVSVYFDSDPKQAIQARRQAFELVANSDVVVLGAHLPSPGAVKFTKDTQGKYSYTFVPPQQ